MTDFIDGAAVFDAREAAIKASSEAAREPAPQRNSLGWSPRVSVGPDTTSYSAPVDPGPAFGSHLNPDNPDVLATGRTPAGFQRHMSELQPSDHVTVNGTPLEVKVALRLGYLDGSPGNYRDTGLAAKEAGMSGAQEKPKAEVKPEYTGNETAFEDHQTENLLGSIAGSTHADHQIRAMVDVTNKGEVSADTIRAMADSTGVSPQQIEADLARVQNAFAAQAAKFVVGSGVPDPEAFFEWAEANHRGRFKDAMSQHVLDRNPKAYAKLVSTYLAGNAGGDFDEAEFMEAAAAQGLLARKTPGGEIMINIPGIGETSLKTARRNGWLRLSRG